MSALICIREAKHPKIPAEILRQEFGHEAVVDPDTGLIVASGTSVYLAGDADIIREWVKRAGGKLWCSENPMLGNWTLQAL